MDANGFKIYIISAGRWKRGVITGKLLTDYQYVVRKSQEEDYRNNGFGDVWAIDDDLIDGYDKVFEYLVQNAPEKVIAIVDDDIDHFLYRKEKTEIIDDPAVVQAELERLAQITYDLDIGLCTCSPNGNIYTFNGEFAWTGVPGSWKIINRSKIKAKMDPTIIRNVDIDYVMQENLLNRIVLHERYLADIGYKDKDMTTTGSVVSGAEISGSIERMELKWGKYFSWISKRGFPAINIKR